MNDLRLLPASLLVASCLLACAPPPLSVSAYGEDFVEDGIPADVFVDGWQVRFERFNARVANVALESSGTVISDVIPERIVDLAARSDGAGHGIGVLTPRQAFDALVFTLAPDGDVPALYVEGSASKGDVTKSFAWSFATDTTYVCAPGALDDPAVSATQLTIHADHLFYDDLDAADPNVAFDLMAAADADDDGLITRAELEATDITTEERYQVGSRDIADLWGFVEAQSRTVGHIDGEGHCDTGG